MAHYQYPHDSAAGRAQRATNRKERRTAHKALKRFRRDEYDKALASPHFNMVKFWATVRKIASWVACMALAYALAFGIWALNNPWTYAHQIPERCLRQPVVCDTEVRR